MMAVARLDPAKLPDAQGHFGRFGGRFVPETLMAPLIELERAYGKWVLVRRSLGVSSFGLNAVELPPGESIPEHDELGRGHEEVFLVLEGEAVIASGLSGGETVVVEGQLRLAPGTKVDPKPYAGSSAAPAAPPVPRVVTEGAK